MHEQCAIVTAETLDGDTPVHTVVVASSTSCRHKRESQDLLGSSTDIVKVNLLLFQICAASFR